MYGLSLELLCIGSWGVGCTYSVIIKYLVFTFILLYVISFFFFVLYCTDDTANFVVHCFALYNDNKQNWIELNSHLSLSMKAYKHISLNVKVFLQQKEWEFEGWHLAGWEESTESCYQDALWEMKDTAWPILDTKSQDIFASFASIFTILYNICHFEVLLLYESAGVPLERQNLGKRVEKHNKFRSSGWSLNDYMNMKIIWIICSIS